ncbi:MAG: acetate--CoA ligase family protein [Bacteroidetes bacterium]|nr:acetate--CoA ligase family protein [Bacteroidota bacterium]
MLEEFFSPQALAVIGASRHEQKLGFTVLNNIIQGQFRGKVYPINPSATEILGLRCYPNVQSVPKSVDLVVIVVPRDVVIEAVRDCTAAKVKGAIIITAGFRETGPEGAEKEREVVRIARAGGMRVLGPNCLGVIDTNSHLNATFAAVPPLRGSISLMSQSGALCTSILDWARRESVGFSRFVSVGNKADIDEVDLLEALAGDQRTRVVVGYLEGISRGQRFMEVAGELSKKKPIVLMKSGTTAAGQRAVSSHTGTLAGSDAAYDAAFKQAGVIRAPSLESLFDFAVAFARQPVPTGRRLAIVTNAGGPGIMAADACERQDVSLASFTAETIERLRAGLPAAAGVYDPVDVLGDARSDRYRLAMEAILADPNADAVLVLLTPQAMTDIEETARVVVEAAAQGRKSIAASFMGGDEVAPGIKVMHSGRVPNYPFPERAVNALATMMDHREWQQTPPEQLVRFEVDGARVREVLDGALKDGRRALADEEARGIIAAYGLRIPRSLLATSAGEAVAMAEEIGYPTVMKIASPDILHKTDLGGVRVGQRTAEEVRLAYNLLLENANHYAPGSRIWGVTVQEMVPKGRETILGVSHDPQFGHLMMFGLGGIYVEVLRDVVFRVAPIAPSNARAMVRGIRSHALLSGVRGEKPADQDAIVESLLRLSQLVTDFPEIAELDVNPLVVFETGQGATAIDCRILLKPADGS